MKGLFKNAQFQLAKAAVAAGTSTITSDAIDMSGFESLTVLVHFGTITSGGVQSVKLQQSSDDGGSDAYSDIEGSSCTVADTQSDKILPIEINKPLKRYIKVIVSRATQNSVVSGIIALKTEPRTLPVTHGSSVMAAGEQSSSPAEGTA